MNAAANVMGSLGLSLRYWVILVLALAGLYVIGLDQGQTLSAVTGQAAYAQNMLHEIFHDVRHVAAFACH